MEEIEVNPTSGGVTLKNAQFGPHRIVGDCILGRRARNHMTNRELRQHATVTRVEN